MKLLVGLFLVLSCSELATACPDLSGKYTSVQLGLTYTITQTGCESVDVIVNNGSTSYFVTDGVPRMGYAEKGYSSTRISYFTGSEWVLIYYTIDSYDNTTTASSNVSRTFLDQNNDLVQVISHYDRSGKEHVSQRETFNLARVN